MALTELDRRLIQRCLSHEPEAWREFVDRFLGVVYHVIHHSAHMRSMVLTKEMEEDLAADVMTQIVDQDFKVLRRFRGKSSLATYLSVIARRVVVNQLARTQAIQRLKAARQQELAAEAISPDLAIETREEVKRLLDSLEGREAELVRSFYLEHKTYSEISQEMGIPENSVGPTLSRIRARLRNGAARP